MALRPKNWSKFQHYKDRRPAWIKLHRELLDSRDFLALKGEDGKFLILIWLIASEENGDLPVLEDLAFRLRMPLEKCEQLVSRLDKWLEQDAIKVASKTLAIRSASAIPEKRREETEEEKRESSASAPPPDPGLHDEEIPEGLSQFQYAEKFCETFGIPIRAHGHDRGLPAQIAATVVAASRIRRCELHEAFSWLLEKARGSPPPKGNWWKWCDSVCFEQTQATYDPARFDDEEA